MQAQEALVEKLCAELEDEREASSSAVSEALSMIHRLQAEKAALKLEASQYKRLAEEKLFHVQDSLDTLEDLLFHKDMEVASLGFQLRAYESKLGRDEQVKEIADYRPLIPPEETSTVCLKGSGETCQVQVHDIFEVPKLEEREKGIALVPKLKESPKVDSKGELKRLRRRVAALESGSNREEERRLLAEIQEQLSDLRAEIRDLKETRQAPENKEDQQVHCLKEAMLHFWF